MNKLIKNKKLLLLIITIQEAFAAIIPYILLLSSLTLAKFFISYIQLPVLPVIDNTLNNVIVLLQKGTSIVITISISYFLSIRLKVSQAIAIILSIASLLSIFYISTFSLSSSIPLGFSPIALFTPIISTYFLYILYPKFTLNLPTDDENKHIYKLFNYIFVFIVTYFVTIVLYCLVELGLNDIFDSLSFLSTYISDFVLYLFRDLFVQLNWFLGIHGDHTANAILGKSLLDHYIFPNLTYIEFNRLFVVIGGSGIGLALLIAMLIHIKEKSYKLITKISIPFVIFNINTLLIYSLVVLNRFLFIPFIFLPIANIIIAYIAINIFGITFESTHIAWMTPVFFDSYIKTGGSITAWILQFGLILFDTAVYAFFIKKFQLAKNLENKEYILKKNLELEEEITSKMNLNAFKAHKEIIEADAKIEKILENLTYNNLYVYYQPKVSLKTYSCNRFEALLRYSDNGVIIGPVFLPDIEKVGLAPIIDIWVVKQVQQHITKWQDSGFSPQISVNLHPDTIQSKDAIDKIIHILKGHNIVFEIIERSFLNSKVAENNLLKLRQNKFKIAVDDFGVGYSSLETLIKYDIDELKLDKSVIDNINNIKGRIISKNMIILCHEMGYKVVAEGVEELDQVETLQSMDIDYIQGFYFAKAIAFDEVVPFSENFKEKYTIKKVLDLINKS